MLENMEDQIKIFMIGFKIWAKREKISQTTAGKVIGLNQSTVSDYYRGNTRPRPETINKWLNHYNLDYEDILDLGREKIKQPHGTEYVSQNITKTFAEDVANAIIERTKGEQTPTPLSHALLHNFPDKKKGVELSHLLFKLAKLEAREVDKAIDYLKERIAFQETIKGLNPSVGTEVPDKNGTVGE